MKPAVFYLAGACAAPLFLASVVIGGARRTGYSHLGDPVSALGMAGAPGADLINGLWAVVGVLIMALGLALWLDRRGPGRWAAGWLIGAGASSAAIALWFPMDPPGVPASREQIGHNVLVAVAALAFALAVIASARSAVMPCAYRVFAWVALAAMVAGGAGAALSGALGWPLIGLFERVTQGGYQSWVLVTAILGLWSQAGRQA